MASVVLSISIMMLSVLIDEAGYQINEVSIKLNI